MNGTSTDLRRGWLWLLALSGVALIAASGVWTLRFGQNQFNIVPSLTVDIGIALLLFSVLFLVERRIERQIDAALRALTPDQARDSYHSGQEEAGDFREPGGPLELAMRVVEAIEADDFTFVWKSMDTNMRTCRLQAWIYNNLDELNLPSTPCNAWDELLDDLMIGPHTKPGLWSEFASCELRLFRRAITWDPGLTTGWSQRRRIVGPRHERIVMIPVPKGDQAGFEFTADTWVHDNTVLCLSCDQNASSGVPTYRLASFGSSVPLPGWPPTWWLESDTVARANHPGLTDEGE